MFKKEQSLVNKIWLDRKRIREKSNIELIKKIVNLLDTGKIRVAELKEKKWKSTQKL